MANKLGRNDPCWCGSGKKYKKCHLNREHEKPLPPESLFGQIKNAKPGNKCLHPEASSKICGKVISSHSLQRSRVLKCIKDEQNHLIKFSHRISGYDLQYQIQKKGWKQAATFEAFCDKHDDSAFAPLEKKDFIGDKEQIFLIGYRAICWELYQKKWATNTLNLDKNSVDRGATEEDQRTIQGMLNTMRDGFEKGIEDLEREKKLMDNALIKKDYSAFQTLEILIEGPVSVASTGAIIPNTTLEGEALQVLHDPNLKGELLSFGVDFNEKRGTSVVFLCLAENKAPRRYIDQVYSLEDSKLSAFLPQFLFSYCENTYFSESWWNGLKKSDQDFVKSLAYNSNPSYDHPQYDFKRQLAPWKIKQRFRF